MEMLYDLKMEILNGQISLTPNLGFADYYSHMELGAHFLFVGGGTIKFIDTLFEMENLGLPFPPPSLFS